MAIDIRQVRKEEEGLLRRHPGDLDGVWTLGVREREAGDLDM